MASRGIFLYAFKWARALRFAYHATHELTASVLKQNKSSVGSSVRFYISEKETTSIDCVQSFRRWCERIGFTETVACTALTISYCCSIEARILESNTHTRSVYPLVLHIRDNASLCISWYYSKGTTHSEWARTHTASHTVSHSHTNTEYNGWDRDR